MRRISFSDLSEATTDICREQRSASRQDSMGRQVKHTQSTIFVTVATGDYVLGRDPLLSVVGSVERGVVGSAGSKRVG